MCQIRSLAESPYQPILNLHASFAKVSSPFNVKNIRTVRHPVRHHSLDFFQVAATGTQTTFTLRTIASPSASTTKTKQELCTAQSQRIRGVTLVQNFGVLSYAKCPWTWHSNLLARIRGGMPP